MSPCSTSAVPPWPVMAAASASSRSLRRAASATAAPWAASAAAVAALAARSPGHQRDRAIQYRLHPKIISFAS
jgi:hypothetical protein